MRFKDYYQFAHPTRIVAGREMIAAVGFEFAKDGAKRPLVVTDEVIRGTGLIEKVEEGLADGGLEPAGIFDGVPELVEGAMGDGCPLTNPRELVEEDFERLYQAAL